MTEKDKHEWLGIAAIIIILLVIWLWMRRGKNASQNAAASPLPATALWGPGGHPFAQGSQGVSENPTISEYNVNVPVPSYGYGGNSSVYMPLFGFVGYSSYGTYG